MPDPVAAKAFIDRVGICTLYPTNPEVPNLFHAYVSDPNAKGEAKWDSPSGQIYTWRWELGKVQAAFYAVLIGKKPTFVAWHLLPLVLAINMDPRHPEELYELGELSANALKIARALEENGQPMGTDALRKAAEFPVGKPHRTAYLKALEELEHRLLVAKTFAGDEQMLHALVDLQYREASEQARKLTREVALRDLLATLLREWVVITAKPLARGLRLPHAELVSALQSLPGITQEGDTYSLQQ